MKTHDSFTSSHAFLQQKKPTTKADFILLPDFFAPDKRDVLNRNNVIGPK